MKEEKTSQSNLHMTHTTIQCTKLSLRSYQILDQTLDQNQKYKYHLVQQTDSTIQQVQHLQELLTPDLQKSCLINMYIAEYISFLFP